MEQTTTGRWACPSQGGRADPLTIEVSPRDAYTRVVLGGEADVTVHGRLAAALAGAAAAGPPCLVLDVSGLTFIDVACLRVLWRMSMAAQQAGGTLRLAVPQPVLTRVMELTGADQLIGVHGSVAEAAAVAEATAVAVSGSRPRAGQRGVDDDVRQVVVRLVVEGAPAGDHA